MNRNRWMVVIAVALVLSAGLTYLIIRVLNKSLQPPEENTKIVVAAQKLPLGKRITEQDIKLADWPKSFPLEGSFQNIETVIDRGVVATIYPNEPIIDAKLAPREGGAGLPAVIPDGMRAVSVKVDSVIGVAGFVLPGTRVDVILTGKPSDKNPESRIILENVQVLTAGTNVEQDANGKPQDVPVVTLLVTPEQAQKLALAGMDRIQLALRNPLDTEEKDPKAVDRASLFLPEKPETKPATAVKKSVRPKPVRVAAPPPAPPKPEPAVRSIEMISGNEKETLKFTEPAP